MIVKESDYVSHFGVLGMRWGHRNSGTTLPKRSTEHKILVGVTAAVGYKLTKRILYKATKSKKLSTVAAGATAYAGAKYLDKHLREASAVRLSDLG